MQSNVAKQHRPWDTDGASEGEKTVVQESWDNASEVLTDDEEEKPCDDSAESWRASLSSVRADESLSCRVFHALADKLSFQTQKQKQFLN